MEPQNGNIEKRQSIQGNRGKITSRPASSASSRDSIVRNYTAQDEARARSARMQTNEAMQNFQEREKRNRERMAQREAIDARRREEERLRAEYRRAQREKDAANARTENSALSGSSRYRTSDTRIRQPLTSQESHEQTKMSREQYEQARARRDVLSANRSNRTSNREVIDGRGSIDSRAFNEKNELVGYSIDKADTPEPAIDASNPKTKWHSHAGQGFGAGHDSNRRLFSTNSRSGVLGSISDSISGHADYSNTRRSKSIPTSIKIIGLVILVLIIILVLILVL